MFPWTWPQGLSLLWILISIVTLSALALAAPSSQNLQMKASPSVKRSSLEGSLSADYSQSLIDQEDGSRQEQGMATLRLANEFVSNWKFAGQISLSQDFRQTDSPRNGASDLNLEALQKKQVLSSWLSGQMLGKAILPLSDYSKRSQNLQGSLGTGYGFHLRPEMLAKGFSTGLSLNAFRNFHQFETDLSGNILNPYSLRESIYGRYSWQRWSFSAEFLHIHAWNYENRVTQSYSHSEEMAFAFKPWSVALGHTNSGAWYKANGQDSDLSLIDENDSIVYLSAQVSF